MNNKTAVIFDMDGVISNTVRHHIESESQVIAKYGINMTPEEIIAEFNAVPDALFFKTVLERYGKEGDVQAMIKEKIALYKKLAEEELDQIPGSVELIQALHDKQIPIGVASSSPKEILDLVLKTLNITHLFTAITSTEEVEHGKPHPDIFLLAAKKMNIDPKDCVVIEDSGLGVKAAKKARMKCIGITTTHTKKELYEADTIIDSFEEITPAIIQQL